MRAMPLQRLPHVIRFGFGGGVATLFQLWLLAALVGVGLDKGIAL